MSKRDELIKKYTEDIKDKFGEPADVDFLTKVTIGCGPAIYGKDAETVSASSEKEIETVKKNFLIKKLGLEDGPELDEAIASVMEAYGKSNRYKYRAVVYYKLAKHFKKESIYNK